VETALPVRHTVVKKRVVEAGSSALQGGVVHDGTSWLPAAADPNAGDDPPVTDRTLPVPVEKPVPARRLRSLLARRRQSEAFDRRRRRFGRFAGRLSHELRTPPSVPDVYRTVARERRDDEAFARCRAATDRMDRAVSDPLRAARERETPVAPVATSLPTVVDACWDAVAIPGARLEVRTDRRIVADEDRPRELLEKPVPQRGRTRADAPTGGRRGRRRERRPRGDGHRRGPDDGFYVADDGIGIPATDRDDGTGPWLVTVAGIADAHGWEVRLTDGPAGRGRFEVTGVETV